MNAFSRFSASLSLIAFAMLASQAFAADATVSWTNPTQNTDNTAIPATGAGSIASTRIEFGTCSGAAFGTKAGEVTAPGSSTSIVISGHAPGATVCFRAYAKNTFGVESAASAVASKDFPAPTPKPPVLGTINVVAYDVIFKRNGRFALGRPVGTVPLGTECKARFVVENAIGDEHYRVPRKAVSFFRNPRSNMIVAQCEWS